LKGKFRGAGGCKALSEMLLENSILEHLNLEGIFYFHPFFNLIYSNCILKGNGIGTEGCKALSKVLLKNSTLQHLNLEGIFIFIYFQLYLF
jgi:hypothetical protein